MPLARAALFREAVGDVGLVGVGAGVGLGPVMVPVAEEGPLPAQAVSTIPAAIISPSRRDIPLIVPLRCPAAKVLAALIAVS
jgi:hypothetical protein